MAMGPEKVCVNFLQEVVVRQTVIFASHERQPSILKINDCTSTSTHISNNFPQRKTLSNVVSDSGLPTHTHTHTHTYTHQAVQSEGASK